MEFSFDKITDVLYIQFSREKIEDSDEIAPGIIGDYSEDRILVGLELLSFSGRGLNLNHLRTLPGEELIAAIVQEP